MRKSKSSQTWYLTDSYSPFFIKKKSTHKHTCVHKHIHTCTHTHVHIPTRVRAHTDTHTHAHARMHTHAHARTRAHTHQDASYKLNRSLSSPHPCAHTFPPHPPDWRRGRSRRTFRSLPLRRSAWPLVFGTQLWIHTRGRKRGLHGARIPPAFRMEINGTFSPPTPELTELL